MKPWEIELISVMSSSHVDDLQTNTLKFVKEMLKDIVKDVDKTPDRKSTRLNSSHVSESRMPSSA